MISLLSKTSLAAVDGGGRDVTVALFSSRTLHALTLTPVGPHAWIAHCAACSHRPLQAPIHITGPTEVFAGGTYKITDAATADSRTATGLWHIRSSGEDRALDVVLTMPSERYVASVLNAEAAPQEPAESLRALAVVTRTYALNGTHYTAQPGHLLADLCDSTACQAMMPGTGSDAISKATRDTAGETLWFGGRRAEVYFSQSCGGITEDATAVWPKSPNLPYLRSHPDPYCVRLDRAAWHTEVPLAAFADIARAEGWHVPENIKAVQITQRSASHRALRVGFTGSNGATSVIAANALRLGIGRSLGWNRVRSDAYELAILNGALVFDGRGHGHGVGLCQAGSMQMALQHKGTRDILAFYFPGTTVGVLQNDGGWQEVNLGPLKVRTTVAPSEARKSMMLQTWVTARARFQTQRPLVPVIITAPSSEMFRQLATQPGWALASTQGSTIVMQPDTVFRTQKVRIDDVLLHEMLHVLVEAEATDRAPLWLREGLVEVLTGEQGKNTRMLSSNEIERVLLSSDSLAASSEAHLAAAALVRSLTARYGSSVVRGWLKTGVPLGVV